MKVLIILFLFSFLSIDLYSQGSHGDELVKVSGKIFNRSTREPVPFAQIADITRHTATGANEEAAFSFVISRHDTLRFSAVGFEEKLVTFSDSLIKNAYYLTILMKPMAYMMEEINIYANDPMAGFRRDTTKTTKYKFSSGGGGDNTAMILGAKPSASGYITDFANLFNSHYQQEKKLGKIIEKDALDRGLKNHNDSIQMIVDTRYNHFVIHRITNLNGNELDAFIKVYRPTNIFILTASDYDLALQIVTSFRDYQKKHGLEVDMDEILRRAIFKN